MKDPQGAAMAGRHARVMLARLAAVALAMTLASGWAPPGRASSPSVEAAEPSQLGTAPRLEFLPGATAERHALRVDAAIIDTLSREAVTAAYREGYLRSSWAQQGWTGNVTQCERGTVSPDYVASTIGMVNYFRNLAGLPGVSAAPALNDLDQAAALIMDANDSLTHSPTPNARCYSSEGYEGASHSNLCYGCIGPSAIVAYMTDFGANNLAAGHRRWILYPPQTTLGTGSTPQADALYVLDWATWVRPADAPEWISWPPPGFVPNTNIYPRFSLSRQDADFSAATVEASIDGQPVTAPVISRAASYGDPAIVFEIDLGAVTLDDGDHVLGMTVDGIDVAGSTVSHSWQTTSFVPELPVARVDPGEHGFGEVTIGTASSQVLTIANDGEVDLHLGPLSIDSRYSSDPAAPGTFALTNDTCSLVTLAPAASCALEVTFAPTATGWQNSALYVPSDGVSPEYGIWLSGTGVNPLASPVGVVATGISDSEVWVTWADVAGESGYRVRRDDGSSPWPVVGTVGRNVTSFTDLGLAADTDYQYRVCAFNATSETCSADATGRTLPTGAVLATTKLVDDRNGGFRKDGSGWHRQLVGYRGRSFWTPVRASGVRRYATWTAALDAPGRYEVWVKVPRKHATTRRAAYRVYAVDGVWVRTVNQFRRAGRWTRLGTYEFAAEGRVKVTDRTGEATSSGRSLVVDVVRFVPVDS